MSQSKKTKAELLKEVDALQQQVEEMRYFQQISQSDSPGSELLESGIMAGFVLTKNNQIIEISEELAKIIGYHSSELVGKPILSLVARESKKTARDSATRSFSGPTRAFVVHKNGDLMLVETLARDIEIDGETVRAIAIRELAEHEGLLEALIKSEERFSVAFHTSPDSININRLSDGLYIEINQGFTDITGYKPSDVIGKTSLELDIWDDPKDRERMVEGLVKDGEVVNLEAVFRMKDGRTRIGLMSAKIIEIGDVPHIISVTRDIAERKADKEKIESLNQELLAAYDETLAGWSRALNLRDPNTDRHSKRVVELTFQLAEAVGVPKSEMVHIHRGVLLHDIGKMGVPDSILLKPGPLTPEEWKIMYKHPVFAYEMLSAIPFLEKAIDIPYCHHEKWDGSGYPRGLRGKEIPLAARIFSVIDNYDALLSDRSYRPAWQHNDALAYIREQIGLSFDPEIAGTFLKMR